MAEHSKIEWTDATWNPIVGCSVISPGCTNCYAMRLAGTRMKTHPTRDGLTVDTKAGPIWTGKVRLIDHAMTEPLRWRRPRRIFVGAHTDIFHEDVPDEWLDRLFAVMALSPQHTFQVLTKRPKGMRAYLTDGVGRIADTIIAMRKELGLPKSPMVPIPWGKPGEPWFPLPNVWLGVSIEDQRRADERIPVLLDTPAAVRWVSAEPLLGHIDIAWALSSNPLDIAAGFLARGLFAPGLETLRPLQWGVAGGESGPGARPMHPDWARSLRDQCAAAGVPFLFKQWGEWASGCTNMTTGEMVFRRFETFQQWVNKASTWVNGGICIDAAGRRCEIGADMQRARDEGTFPVTIMHKIGKRAAGRHLDGALHDAYPEITP